MVRLVVVFLDGSQNEYLCEDRLDAYRQLNKLKNVWGHEVVAITDTRGVKHIGNEVSPSG